MSDQVETLVSQFHFKSGQDNCLLAIHMISQTLDLSVDARALIKFLSQYIVQMIEEEAICLLMWEQGRYVAALSTNDGSSSESSFIQLSEAEERHLHDVIQSGLTDIMQEAAPYTTLGQLGCKLLQCREPVLWIPLAYSPEYSDGVVMIVHKPSRKGLNPRDFEILSSIACHLNVKFQNRWLHIELQQRIFESAQLHRQVLQAREEERKRLARELHDQVIQSLICLNYNLSQTRHRFNEIMGEDIISLQEDVRLILGDVRRICVDLRPPALDNLCLASALRTRIRQFETQTALRVALTFEGDQNYELPEEISICVYRVLQEALFNIQKHASARYVCVLLRITSKVLILNIEDDGQGFIVPSHLGRLIEAGHFGLAGLRERVNAVMGNLTVHSYPGNGTRVEVSIPLSPTGSSSKPS